MLCEIWGVKKADSIRMQCASWLKEYIVFSCVILTELKIVQFQKLFSESSSLIYMFLLCYPEGGGLILFIFCSGPVKISNS